MSSDAEAVWYATTPGYQGAVTGSDGMVVYGTGYSYAPYVGSTTYVGYPVTYGYYGPRYYWHGRWYRGHRPYRHWRHW